jgi:release factor glutamine methyltransferase
MPAGSWKLLEILQETSGFFHRKGLDSPRLQAELLLADVLRLRRIDLYLQFERLLADAEVDAYREHVRQRAQGRPVQYITGSAGFRELILAVHDGVLIPRPETEEVAGAALEMVRELAAPRVLDLGCGTGAIGLSIADEHPTARIVAVDLAAAATANTQANASQLGLDQRVVVLQGDLFEPLGAASVPGDFDLIVSNPPYVRHGDIATLQREVRDWEPHLALDGGVDGLAVYRRIIPQAAAWLGPVGRLVLELGDGQRDAVSALVAAGPGLALQAIRPDLRGVPRVLIAGRLDP